MQSSNTARAILKSIQMTWPAWQTERGSLGTGHQVGGLQQQTASTPRRGTRRRNEQRPIGAEEGRSASRSLVRLPATSSVSPTSQPAGGGLHRTVPAWRHAGNRAQGDSATRQVGVLQQESALATPGGAGSRGSVIAVNDTRVVQQGGRVQATELGPTRGSDSAPVSPPRLVGTSRRRSGSSESTSTRPRARPRHLSP